MTATIAAMQAAAKELDATDIGYDQSQRWSFIDDKGAIASPSEADFSSLCGGIIKLAGYVSELPTNLYTGNFADFVRGLDGWEVIPFKSLSQVKPGDFLLRPGRHIEFAYTEKSFFSAHIDERGAISGGAAGDPTGREVYFRSAYLYAGGWTSILRPPADKSKVITVASVTEAPAGKQADLKVDGDMFTKTIGRLQEILGTPVDHVISRPSLMVEEVQHRLNVAGARD